MVRRRIQFLVAMIVAAFASSSAHAFNMQFASDTPIANFSSEDRAKHEAMLTELLESTPDGKSVSWATESTRSGGQGVALRTLKRQGKTCRDIQIKTYYRALKATNGLRACRGEDGKWSLEN
ncbi:hypothetical protein [Niveibacterium sp. COAC-50]|uniref:hypothetical protein n=1 Tax=Niveibacterium sp. COAC-50 TaxID=2729384 RepID=UPI001554ABB2|nr:hypothetical protein [Niveibacterium sp. COAC-50]